MLKHNIQYFESEESLAFHLEVRYYFFLAKSPQIRFGQLNTAVALELWQEAYKSIEDINNNLIYPAKVPIPKESLLDYYRQLEKLYWVCTFVELVAYKTLGLQKLYVPRRGPFEVQRFHV